MVPLFRLREPIFSCVSSASALSNLPLTQSLHSSSVISSAVSASSTNSSSIVSSSSKVSSSSVPASSYAFLPLHLTQDPS